MTIETRPSGAHRWTRCAAAPLFASQSGPQPTNDAAREGTCAAWAAELKLTGKHCYIGLAHENGWEIDAEMMDHVQNYVDICRADGGQLWAEEHLILSPRIKGTADCATLADGVLTIRDLKYGFRLVDADSPQLIIYAGAALAGMETPATTIRTEIYQPRGFHPRGPQRYIDWTPDDIRTRCAEYIAAAEACYAPDPVATPGPHCLYCDAAASCAALQQTTAQALAVVEMTGHRDRTAAEMAQALHFYRWAIETIQAGAKATEAEATARARRGETLPGWGIVEKRGQTRVTASPTAIRALTGMSGTKETPMNVGELRAAGLTDEQLAVITERPVTGHKLTPLDPDALIRQFGG